MTGPWNDYFEANNEKKRYRCPNCKAWNGEMKRREVREPSGDSHKEYKIECISCGYKSSVHWSKRLTEKVWESEGGGML